MFFGDNYEVNLGLIICIFVVKLFVLCFCYSSMAFVLCYASIDLIVIIRFIFVLYVLLSVLCVL